MRAVLFALLLAGSSVAPAAAFAQYDPYASRAENQINSLNRDISRQEQALSYQQQQQFETNALRNTLSQTPPPSLAPGVGVGAPLRR